MSLPKQPCVPINNMYALPARNLYVYLSNPTDKTKTNQVIYKGTKPPIKTADPQIMLQRLLKLFTQKEIKKYFKSFQAMDQFQSIHWVDVQNWDYPGHTVEMKQMKREYLDTAVMIFAFFAQSVQKGASYMNKLPTSALVHCVGMGNITHCKHIISKKNEWNMDEILSRCIEIFDQMQKRKNCNSRCIYPHPIYRFHGNEARGRRKQWNLAQEHKWTDDPLGLLGQYCYMGHWQLFTTHLSLYFGNNVNFNVIFLGEIEFSLLYLTMSGYRGWKRNCVQIEISQPFQPSHLRIAQYLIDNGLDVNIQNKFGYTALQEIVINFPDREAAKFLLENGADPNIYNIFCSTALHGASMQINVECVKLLCDYGANPLLYNFQGYRVLDISSARNHIEVYTILCNQARKIKENRDILEYEDASYCFVCKKSNKRVKLYRCAKCISSERYCSSKCQKRDWKRHKTVCNRNRMRVSRNSYVSQKQLLFSVVYCGDDIMPMWQCQNQMAEWNKNEIDGPKIAEVGAFDIKRVHEEKHEEYRAKKAKQCQKQYQRSHQRIMKGKQRIKSMYPPCGINLKFVVKIQAFPNDKSQRYLLCYDKSREYMVRIFQRKQKKQWKELYKFVVAYGIDTNDAKKGYFYAFVDKKKKLHILIDDMVAAQPW